MYPVQTRCSAWLTKQTVKDQYVFGEIGGISLEDFGNPTPGSALAFGIDADFFRVCLLS
jgi:hypothetical protein